MARVENDGYYTSLPEIIRDPLIQAFGIARNTRDMNDFPNEDLEAVLNWAENTLNPVPDMVRPLVFMAGIIPDGNPDLERLVAIFRHRLLVDVVNGELVFIDYIDYLKAHPEVLAMLREGEPCETCNETECPIHPSKFEAVDQVPENDIAPVELPASLEDLLNGLLAEDDDEDSLF